MKNRINILLFCLMALFLIIPVVSFAQGEGSAGSDTVNIISYILNAVLAAVSFFVNNAKEKAKEGLVKAESKAEQAASWAKNKTDIAVSILNKVVASLKDDKVTPEEIKSIVDTGKELLSK